MTCLPADLEWTFLPVSTSVNQLQEVIKVLCSNYKTGQNHVIGVGGGLYLEGRFNGGFFALPVWGSYIWRGLYMEGLIFGILRYFN